MFHFLKYTFYVGSGILLRYKEIENDFLSKLIQANIYKKEYIIKC